MKHLGRLLVVFSLAGGFASGFAFAQDEDTPKEKKEDTAKRQAALREAYKQFEDKLNESENAFRKLEPEKAQRLHRAVEASREAFDTDDGKKKETIWERMQRIVELLDARNNQGALVVEKEVLDALERVLELLEADDQRKDDHLDVKRLEQLKKELEQIIKDQKAHKDDVAKARDLEAKARAVNEAVKKIGEILDQQKKLTDKTGDMKSETAPDLSKEQKDLEKQTADLKGLMELVDKIGGADEPQPGAGEGKPGEGKPGEGKPGQGQPSPATKSIDSAKNAMGEAAKNLDDQKKPQAQERQRKAIEDLEEAKRALEKKRAVIDRLAQIEKKKAEEEALRQRTAELAKKFGEQPAQPQPGNQGGGKGQGKGGGGKGKGQGQVPGKRHIERAEDEQKRAGDDLENRHMKDAEEKEDQAVQQLQQAEEALREALIQARKREQEETLKALGQHFLAMLAKQQDLSKRTILLDSERKYDEKGVATDLNRKQKIECAAIAKGEGELRDETEQTIELTTEEGGSTILPTVLGELKEDLARVTELLDKRDTGRFVQSVQKDIERTLEELIEVIKKEIEERKNGGGGGGGGDDKNGERLLPASAELKMIRAQQMRVNNKTKDFDLGRGTPLNELTSDQREACRMIAEKQGRVAEFTRRLHTKLNKEE